MVSFCVVAVAALLTSCNAQRDPFPPETEFGLRLKVDVNTKKSEARALKFNVDYPEEFHGDVVEGVITGGAGDATVGLSSLQHRDSRLCLSGNLIGVANSKGLRGLDENGVPATVQTVRSAPVTTMVTQDICTGQGDQLSCSPMVYPMEVPGTASTILHGSRGSLRFKPGSLMIFKMSGFPCKSAK